MFKIKKLLDKLYGSDSEEILTKLQTIVNRYEINDDSRELDQSDCMLITYGDSITSDQLPPIQALHNLLSQKVGDRLSAVHLLPFYPYSSDDGFSVIDYREVNPSLGRWMDVEDLAVDYDLMFDAVVNHISSKSSWVKGYLSGDPAYDGFFIECDSEADYSMVTRPRALPLLTEFDSSKGRVHLWTTFSSDQIDLNFSEPKVLLEIMDILLMYASKGARYIRLDAIGFLWKKMGTSCMHLEETHDVIRLMRLIMEEVKPDVVLITETNVPHEENVSYFGNGDDEAHMVYQFPLPPLTMHAFMREDASALTSWARGIHNLSEDTSYFNFLASHDGIGVRPVEGLLPQSEVEAMAQLVKDRGGRVSYRTMPDGSQSPYELNISYLDAVCEPNLDTGTKAKKFMASQAILLSVIGVPGIYIHSLLGSRNDIKGMEKSGINRRINREKLDYDQTVAELENKDSLRFAVFEKYMKLLKIRKGLTAFSPRARQQVLEVDKRVFALRRHNDETGDEVEVFINLSSEPVAITGGGYDLISETVLQEPYLMAPYEVVWKVNHVQ